MSASGLILGCHSNYVRFVILINHREQKQAFTSTITAKSDQPASSRSERSFYGIHKISWKKTKTQSTLMILSSFRNSALNKLLPTLLWHHRHSISILMEMTGRHGLLIPPPLCHSRLLTNKIPTLIDKSLPAHNSVTALVTNCMAKFIKFSFDLSPKYFAGFYMEIGKMSVAK